jgi:hypothetical protein
MLYDPKWEKKVDPLSLDGVIAWLETQDPATEYDWSSTLNCLLCRYLKSQGWNLLAYVSMATLTQSKAMERPWTYGAALERFRKL